MSEPTRHKRCTGCGETKPVDQFNKDRQKSDGLTSRCRSCRREDQYRWAQSESGRKSQRRARRKYYKAHPEVSKALGAAWREAHPGYSAEKNREWRERNPDGAAQYHQANRDKAMLRVILRRKRIAESRIGPVDLDRLWRSCDGHCGLCGEPIDPSRQHPDPLSRSVDHIVPLSKGGTHEQSNLQWTHLVCNIRKGATVPD